MTLKCKIKELSEMSITVGKQSSPLKDEGTWFDLEAADDELELKELGSIEEVSKQIIQQRKKRRENKARNTKEKVFYDKQMGGYRKKPFGIVAGTRHERFQPYRYDDYPYQGYYDRDYGEGYWEHDAYHYNAGYYRSYQKVHYLDRDRDIAPRYKKTNFNQKSFKW